MSERLKNRDYYLAIDKSGSMETEDTSSGQSRFKFAEESTIALAKKLEAFDPDGICVIPFGSTHKVYDNVTGEKVADIFKENQPFGSTNLSPVLKHCFDDYLKKKKAGSAQANGAILVIMTDGAPSDPAEVKKAIVDFSQKLDNGDGEFGILFLQVGKDAGAGAYLTELDDNLKGAKFDIVDKKTFEEVESLGILGALEASLDD